ncbi:NAD-dependent succinate-semialdehyde dehydrogenase [Helicobacter sp. 11S02629-2]|uniref:NAD-dependent succinate-semialdehyde dehydrogenase n=1 Tax=Helicobacter sp. 11S02629-2 TaxID=1476195 RepID=UPI000BA7A6B4|nr:NAD-dependent succinate-semialdehyde dehydrogenase [Helicobacter sp. 11S02629-2]PAF44891.1 succinate-semialdehyde dehydrogenase (NADP(+)) [Helicobacter sp. 11S02629-2]
MTSLKHLLNHPDISFTEVPDSIKVSNPASGETLCYVKKTSAKDLESKIKRSKEVQAKWRELTAKERSDLLMAWHDEILKEKENLALLLTKEMGKSLGESRGEIGYGASFIKFFAEECKRLDGDIIQSVIKNQRLLVLKEPIGVTAAITPWNFPNAMIARKVGPALACGCSMLVKPASATPLSAYALEVLALKVGLPKDLLQNVSGSASEISEVFCKSDIVRKISFTGSTEIGAKLMELGASTIKKLSLELGGNAPVIVFEDANIDKAVEGIMASKFRNSGQTCVCANRIYVQDSIYDALSLKLKARLEALKVGNGEIEGVNQGPLINKAAVTKVEEHVNDAISKGAKLALGGKPHKLGGNFYEPTLILEANEKMLVFKEETFGPVAPLFRFKSEEEVIQKANDTIFGLASYIFTENASRQWRVSEALEYGMVGVNTGLISNEVAPFGGVKQSGLGREGSKYGLEEYCELKYVCLDLR